MKKENCFFQNDQRVEHESTLFLDVERLVDIANKMEDGMQTFEIRRMEQKAIRKQEVREKMLRGQLNAAFNIRK